jgi:dimethylargininase
VNIAIVREPSPSIAQCELTFIDRSPINFAGLRAEHALYRKALEETGLKVDTLPPYPEYPDSVFVEDTAIILDEVAILCRLGAQSRQGETDSILPVLRRYRKTILPILAPGTLEGGDVLRLGKTLYVAVGGRTNAEGVRQLEAHLSKWNYTLTPVDNLKCLHLKTAVTRIGIETLVVNPKWIDLSVFSKYKLIEIDEREPFAANVLRIGPRVILSATNIRTAEKIERAGFTTIPVDFTEIAKTEAGVTCCSLIVE